MGRTIFKTIVFTAVTTIISLTLLSLSTTLNGYSEGKPNFPNFDSLFTDQDSQSTNTQNLVNEQTEEIALRVQLEPHSSEFLADKGWREVSDFTLVANNAPDLCPQTCEYELENGEMSQASSGDRTLNGKLKIDSGESKKIRDIYVSWDPIEERETANGETIQVIEGTLTIKGTQSTDDNRYQINGTLTAADNDYILEVKGVDQQSALKNQPSLDDVGDKIKGLFE